MGKEPGNYTLEIHQKRSVSKMPFHPAPGLAQISLSSVGADASVRPPMLYRTSCKRCHCETSSQTGRGERAERCQWQKKRGERVAAVKISSVRRKAAQKFWAPQQGHPPPAPSAPLPKGGWHGKAVTGGFHTSPDLLQPFRRGGVLLPTVAPTDSRPTSVFSISEENFCL